MIITYTYRNCKQIKHSQASFYTMNLTLCCVYGFIHDLDHTILDYHCQIRAFTFYP